MSLAHNPYAPPRAASPASGPAPSEPFTGELRALAVEVELREDEFLSHARRGLLKSPTIWTPSAMALFFCVYFVVKSWGSDMPLAAVAVVVLPVALVAAFMAWASWSGPATRFRKLRPEQRQLSYRFEPDSLEIGDKESSTRLTWPLIERFVVEPEALLIYVGGNYHILPRRALGPDFPLAQAWLERKVTQKPPPKLGAWRPFILWAALVGLFFLIYQILAKP